MSIYVSYVAKEQNANGQSLDSTRACHVIHCENPKQANHMYEAFYSVFNRAENRSIPQVNFHYEQNDPVWGFAINFIFYHVPTIVQIISCLFNVQPFIVTDPTESTTFNQRRWDDTIPRSTVGRRSDPSFSSDSKD